MAGFVKAAKTGDIVPGGGKMVEVTASILVNRLLGRIVGPAHFDHDGRLS